MCNSHSWSEVLNRVSEGQSYSNKTGKKSKQKSFSLLSTWLVFFQVYLTNFKTSKKKACHAISIENAHLEDRDSVTPGSSRLHVKAGKLLTTVRRVTSPTGGPQPPCKQNLTLTSSLLQIIFARERYKIAIIRCKIDHYLARNMYMTYISDQE